ncbi:MAG: hypothetical protein ACR2IK_17115, partial [Chloroflexota bacterium]
RTIRTRASCCFRRCGQPSQVVCNDCSYWAIDPDLSIFELEQRGHSHNVIVLLRQLASGEQYYFYE